MCGICGIYRHAPQDDLIVTSRTMLDAMRYRGPDQQGLRVFDQCVIGANRLSIIDIKNGDQPVHNEDGSLWIVYNGEVYNFRELKKDLASAGHGFYTGTDTEVIVHLYEQYGIEGFAKLNGMFAFAIYDGNRKRLILARDRIGIKPLYYSLTDGIVFASELKAMLALQNSEYKLDLPAVAQYLTHDYTPAPNTIIKGIFKLMPGVCIVKEQDRIYKKTFSEIKIHTNKTVQNNRIQNEKKLEMQLEGLLSDAVKDQMAADVPVGVLLSGGIDSSTIAYFASKIAADINSFSIAFDEPSFDESRYAMIVSRRLGLRHYSELFTYTVFRELFDRITDFIDEPVADPSVIPTYYLSRLAGEHVKVVLSGEGGDEMFAGYPTYIAHRFISFYSSLPALVRKGVFEPLIHMLPVSSKNFSLDFVAKRFIGSALMPVHKRHIQWMSGFTAEGLSLIFKEELLKDIDNGIYKQAEELVTDVPGMSEAERANILDIFMYLPDDLLVKVDRATMSASIESRVPLLDNRLVEFSMSLPFEYKIRGITGKYLLKNLMRNKLPREVVSRKKKGFGIPITRWLQNDFRHEAESILSEDSVGGNGIFNHAYIDRLLKEHASRIYDHRKKLWPLLVLVKWLQKYKLGL